MRKNARASRRSPPPTRTDLLRRLADVEDMARVNRRELELQFQRMAQMQVEIDKLKQR